MSQKQEHSAPFHLPNAASDVVALAASLGGLRALSQVLSAFPPKFPAAIVVVQHLSPKYPSHLTEILSRCTSLKVKQAESGDQLRSGMVYVAPPNKHLLVKDTTLSLSQSERVNFSRPSADVLFESVAISFRQRAIAVVLTGKAGDGATGCKAIKKMGGKVIVQDETTSECFSMPKSAIATGSVDLVLSLSEISTALISLVMTEEKTASVEL